MSTTTDERQRDAERKRASRLQSRRVYVSVDSGTLRQRKAREKNIEKWLRHYFPDVFEYDFTDNQAAIVRAILTAAKEGGDQAIAAPRGDGKTSICECVIIYCVLTGILSFPVIFSATGEDAERILANIKQRFEESERLVADYPEVCVPAAALEGQANRAGGQVVYGNIGKHEIKDQRTKIKWSGRQVMLPLVKAPYSRANGQIIATRGLDAAVRGVRYNTKRPDLSVIDDPETRDIACSEDDGQRTKLRLKIDQDIAGCAGQQRRLARVMLTTIMSRRSLSYEFTDPTLKPSFRGKRFRYMVVPPDRQDLWEEFVALQQADWAADPRTNNAHQFYVRNREVMDAGAVVGNPHRRGNEIEASAIEAYYVEVARVGRESVATEYDNDPPEETGPIESGITAHRIMKQVSGYDRGVVPPECVLITQGIDVGKMVLHWVVRAWRRDGSGFVIDYGVQEVHGTTYGSDEGLDRAVYRALLDRQETFRDTSYAAESHLERFTLVDAGYRTDAIYSACQKIGVGIMPVMGFGKSSGCTQANFNDVQRRTLDRKPGNGWFLSRRGKLWLVCADTDRWKAWEHDRWMTTPGKPLSLQMFGQPSEKPDRLSDDEKSHHAYAHHIVSEVEVEEPYKGTVRRVWKPKNKNTHWLDASYYSDVAAAMKGIKIGQASATPAMTGPTMTLAEMAAAARGG